MMVRMLFRLLLIGLMAVLFFTFVYEVGYFATRGALRAIESCGAVMMMDEPVQRKEVVVWT